MREMSWRIGGNGEMFLCEHRVLKVDARFMVASIIKSVHPSGWRVSRWAPHDIAKDYGRWAIVGEFPQMTKREIMNIVEHMAAINTDDGNFDGKLDVTDHFDMISLPLTPLFKIPRYPGLSTIVEVNLDV